MAQMNGKYFVQFVKRLKQGTWIRGQVPSKKVKEREWNIFFYPFQKHNTTIKIVTPKIPKDRWHTGQIKY